MRIALNESGSLGFSKKLKMSFTATSRIRYRSCCCPSRLLDRRRNHLFRRLLHQLHVQAEGLQLLDEHVERLGEPRLERVLSLDDRLVHAGPADHVVGLDREE